MWTTHFNADDYDLDGIFTLISDNSLSTTFHGRDVREIIVENSHYLLCHADTSITFEFNDGSRVTGARFTFNGGGDLDE